MNLCQTIIDYVRSYYAQFSKTDVSTLINGPVTSNYSVSQPHFVSHLGNCNLNCVKLLQLMCAVIVYNLLKNKVSILINGRATADYGVSCPPFFPPS